MNQLVFIPTIYSGRGGIDCSDVLESLMKSFNVIREFPVEIILRQIVEEIDFPSTKPGNIISYIPSHPLHILGVNPTVSVNEIHAVINSEMLETLIVSTMIVFLIIRHHSGS